MVDYPLPANLFNSVAYFYPNATNELGVYSKDVNNQTLIYVDYTDVVSGGVVPETPTFTVDIGSAPALLITNATISGMLLFFIISEGVEGISYQVTVKMTFSNNSVRNDIIGVDVPSGTAAVQNVAGVINVGNPITGNGFIFLNSGIRYFVSATPPAGANLADLWYNSASALLSLYVFDGVDQYLWSQISPTPGGSSGGGTGNIFTEQLTVTATNTLTQLTNTPVGNLLGLTVNGQTLFAVAMPPPFTRAGKVITWIQANAGFPLAPTDTVIAFYAY